MTDNLIDTLYSIASTKEMPLEHTVKSLHYVMNRLDKVEINPIVKLLNMLQVVRKNKKKIYLIGNGGSAATASHLATDLQKKDFKAISLVDNISLITAIGNDIGYDYIFRNQLMNCLNVGDVLIAFSASGNSLNILKAIEYAKNEEVVTVGFSGFNGGRLKDRCDISIHVATELGAYGPVEDIHMVIGHLVAKYF